MFCRTLFCPGCFFGLAIPIPPFTTLHNFLFMSVSTISTLTKILIGVIIFNPKFALPTFFAFHLDLQNVNNSNDTFYNHSSCTCSYAQARLSPFLLRDTVFSVFSSFLIFLSRSPILALLYLKIMRIPAFRFKST